MLSKIKFVIRNVIRILIAPVISTLIPRSKHILLFSCSSGKTNDMFLNNTKYLYLKTVFQNDYKCIWLTNNKSMIQKMKKAGFKNIYTRLSIKGIYYALRAKYWFTDFSIEDLTYPILSFNAVCINLWHGTGFKRAGVDNKFEKKGNLNGLIGFIYNLLKKKEDYYISTSSLQSEFFVKVFATSSDKIKVLGNPRLDILYNDFKHSNLFLEEDFCNIKRLAKEGKTIIIYMPTFRDTNKNISGWLQSKSLKDYIKQRNVVLVCKLHPFDNNLVNMVSDDYVYIMSSTSDIYPILKYSNILITDYSSIYCDYLLLDRPIIFYPMDYKEYLSTCRIFYRPYNEITPGIKVYNEQDLIRAIDTIIDGIDCYANERKKLRDELFTYQDGNNCKRIINFIEELK